VKRIRFSLRTLLSASIAAGIALGVAMRVREQRELRQKLRERYESTLNDVKVMTEFRDGFGFGGKAFQPTRERITPRFFGDSWEIVVVLAWDKRPAADAKLAAMFSIRCNTWFDKLHPIEIIPERGECTAYQIKWLKLVYELRGYDFVVKGQPARAVPPIERTGFLHSGRPHI